jgi:hypothetical protein
MRPTKPPIQWVAGALSPEVKRPGREADHSPPSSAQVKECVELYLHSPNMPSRRGAQLNHRDNFTFQHRQYSDQAMGWTTGVWILVRGWDFLPRHRVPASASRVQAVPSPGREADHKPPPTAEAKNAWSYTSTLPYVFTARRFFL